MSQLLYSVEEVFSDDGYLKEQSKEFFNIPLYQRGYKWESKHVIKLLNDIYNFEHADTKFYCLQNITIVQKDNYFNVIDGQQRLTTLTILLAYLNQKTLVYNKVRFPNNSIREETNKFLNEIITNNEAIFPDHSWDFFSESNPNYDHQDIYHIYNVYETIEIWFSAKINETPSFDKELYKTKLLKHVKVIINKIDDANTSEEKIFGNLNSKRIALDGADLIRAILITRVAQEEGKREADIKNIVRVNERRVKIGWELDQINNWWSQDNIKNYFSKFVNIRSEEIGVGNKLFNDEKYPINVLYLLFAEKKKEKKLTLELIEQNNNNALGLYKELIKLNSTLQDWFQDREIYHFLGYIFNQRQKREINFAVIWEYWESSETRNEFCNKLKNIIKSSLLVEDDLIDFENSDINWYHKESGKLVSALIVMDIIHCLKENQPFLPPKAFTKSSNDIEHIFPQNPEKIKERKDYVAFLNKNIVKDGKQFDLDEFETKKENVDYINDMNQFIDNHIGSIKINSIGNLVLLYSSLNRSISNSLYSKKRSRIIEFFNNGNFIQPHTFKVFVRYFNDLKNNNNDYEHWTNEDIKANASRISLELKNFLNN
ncbi:DUF262 domain-containing protein [Flavobacterium sp. W22_SRS_FK3]|uniref:DUF262 domain-containing protein n=1 Tax=Flavobacterium sp. W22_SRS_FK3 TaxID=3240275 RepID=UPI003F8F7251